MVLVGDILEVVAVGIAVRIGVAAVVVVLAAVDTVAAAGSLGTVERDSMGVVVLVENKLLHTIRIVAAADIVDIVDIVTAAIVVAVVVYTVMVVVVAGLVFDTVAADTQLHTIVDPRRRSWRWLRKRTDSKEEHCAASTVVGLSAIEK